MRRLRAAVAALAALGCAGATAAPAPARPAANRVLRFVSLERSSTPQQAQLSAATVFAIVADRASEARLQPPSSQPPVDYRRFATVYVSVVRPTAGYTVAIRRLALQRRAAFAQVCARVAVAPPAPGRIVTQVKTRSWHLVRIARRSFGGAVPNGIVVRATTGRVLYARAGTRARLCS